MRWQGRRASTNVEDARSQQLAGSTPGLGMLLSLVGRRFGLQGILVLAVLGFIGWQAGLLDPTALMSGGRVQAVAYQPTAEEEERLAFVKVVLADTEDIWAEEFNRIRRTYQEPELVVYRGQYPTGCGTGDARLGPFYCPEDRKVYIDLSFYDELERQLDAPGDFAQAYVIAHEIGHHVQNLLGISEQVAARRGRPDYNQYSVRLELQADYLAGVWAKHNRRYLDRGDIEEALRAANQIGDDMLQARAAGRVVPHTFTHGTSEQRMRWFRRGLDSGRVEEGDTFAIPYEDL